MYVGYYKNYTIIYAAMNTTVQPANRPAMSRVVLGHKKGCIPMHCGVEWHCHSPGGAKSRVTKLCTATPKDGYTLVTLPRTVTPYRDSVDGTRDRVTYQKLVTR
jgi:hypothetical protein